MRFIIGFLQHLLRYKFNRYTLVGGFATIVDWGTFYLINNFLGFHYLFSLSIAIVLGSTTNFVLNRTYTFESKTKRLSKQLLLYYSVSAASLLLSSAFMFISVSLLLQNELYTRIILTFIMLPINFKLHEKITFHERYFS